MAKRARRYPPFITKRGNLFYANLDVPKDVRHRLRRRYFQSLGTDSLSTAVSRAATLVIRWKSEIKAARQGTNGPLDADLLYWRKILHGGVQVPDDDDGSMGYEIATGLLQDHAEEIEKRAPGAGVKFYKQVTGELVGTLDHLDAYLKTTPGLPKTVAGKRTYVVRMAGQFTFTKDVTRKEVRVWCDAMRQDDGLHPHTIARIVSACRKYWQYLELMEVVPENVDPFDKLHLTTKRPTLEDRRNKRTSFDTVDVVRLHAAAHAAGDGTLADMIKIGMYTGARIEEICQLKVEQVVLDDGDGGHFKIVDAKTSAGDREVPIHPDLLATVERLVADSGDGWLVQGIKSRPGGHRSNAVGKRFSKLKTRLGFGCKHVFHSLRHTLTTELSNALVPRDIIKDIDGHQRLGVTEGYNAGARLDTKREALAKLSYPTDA